LRRGRLTFDKHLSNNLHLLFIGNGPERQDDHSGKSFSGEVGRILNMIFHYTTSDFNFTLTHIVACRPYVYNFRQDTVNRPPHPEEMKECSPRLEQLVQTVAFDGIVYLGKEAQTFHTTKHLGRVGLFQSALNLPNPATILDMEYKLHSIKTSALDLTNYVNILAKGR